jgi:predicted component of type VI protein secretion system
MNDCDDLLLDDIHYRYKVQKPFGDRKVIRIDKNRFDSLDIKSNSSLCKVHAHKEYDEDVTEIGEWGESTRI